ncbi:MAG: glycosyltransferase family protein [Chitinophagaceae bacterium]|nr:glycosyltransferase family protein [Chitinophagaceae bacterium]
MISIIICSVNPGYLKAVSENIKTTIGLPYELLVTDNRNSNKGICKVYNEAAAKAKNDMLCFLHEDVCFHTMNWGQLLITILSDKSVGLVGISGSGYKSAYPGSWTACRKDYYRVNTIQHFKHLKGDVQTKCNPFDETESEVAVIDGVLMAGRKKIWQEHPFDEVMFAGFHGYDLDWSLSVGTNCKVVVTHRILLEHFSEGSYTKEWIASCFAVQRKWKHCLPKNILDPGKTDRVSDYIACSSMLQHLLKTKSSKLLIANYYLQSLVFFFKENRFRFTRVVTRYLLFNHLN